MSNAYGELYRWGAAALEKAGVTEAALDARLLLEYVCHTDRNTLLTHGDRPVGETEADAYREAVRRRAARVPLQHITGTQEFMGLEFIVNEQVLIPRQDTEILVEEVMRHRQDGDRILDMCTGSGCIILSLLHYSNGCRGVAADISEAALATAMENAARLREEAVAFVRSDLFAELDRSEQFDIIVSNPPYIRSGLIGGLMEEVRLHEPLQALDGKEDGLYFYRKIIEESPGWLVGGGKLFFEIGYDQAAEVSRLMESGGFGEVTVVRDFAGLDRVVYGTLIRQAE